MAMAAAQIETELPVSSESETQTVSLDEGGRNKVPLLKYLLNPNTCSLVAKERKQEIILHLSNLQTKPDYNIERNMSSVLCQMPQEIVDMCQPSGNRSMYGAEEQFIRSNKAIIKLRKLIIKMNVVERICISKMKKISSILFLAIINPQRSTCLVYEDKAPGTIFEYYDRRKVSMERTFGICASHLDRYNKKKTTYNQPEVAQNSVVDSIVDEVKKLLRDINWNIALIWDTGDHQQVLKNGFFDEQHPTMIEQVLNIKRKAFVLTGCTHYGLNVMLDTIAFSRHRYSLNDFIISLGFIGFQFLMSVIREERHRVDKLIGETELNWSNISKDLLIKLELIESQIISSPKLKTSATKKPKLDNNMVNDNPFDDQDDGFNLNENCGSSCLNIMDIDYIGGEKQISSKCVEYLSYIRQSGLLVCVNKNLFTFPMYNPENGNVLKQIPTLYPIYNKNQTECTCPLSSKAKNFYSQDQPGFEFNKCWHSQIALDNESRHSLLQMNPSIVGKKSYLKLLAGFEPTDAQYCHVYVYISDTNRKQHAILTVNPNYVKCSICHTGSKQRVGDSKSCPHCEYLWEKLRAGPAIEDNSSHTEDSEYRDLQYIYKVYSSIQKEGGPTFNADTATWEYPSLSASIEKELEENHGIAPIPVPISIHDPEFKGKCPMGPKGTVDLFPMVDGVAQLIPDKLPKTPLFDEYGCVYNDNEESIIKEYSESSCYFIAHMIRVQVYVRHCSCGHEKCRIPWSHRSYHRISKATMVRNEVPLIYWVVVTTMNGPGAAAYVELSKILFGVAELPGLSPDESPSKFFGVDTMRKLNFGYLARQRVDMRRRCPKCEPIWNEEHKVYVNGCDTISVDVKRLRSKIHEADTPEKLNENSDCERTLYLTRNELNFFPGNELTQSRHVLRSICGTLINKKYTGMLKLEVGDQRISSLLVPNWYVAHARILIDAYNLKLRGDDDSPLFIVHETELIPLEVNQTVVYHLASVFYWILHDSCVATQYVTQKGARVMNEVLQRSSFDKDDIRLWKTNNELRLDLVEVIEKCCVPSTLSQSAFELHPLVRSLFDGFLKTVTILRVKADANTRRNFIPEHDRVSPDASTGVWTNFTSSSTKFANWVHWDKRKTKRPLDMHKMFGYEECQKPDWTKDKHPTQSEGVLTIMCLKSRHVLATIFLTGHEGRKDCVATLWCYHPVLGKLEYVISDTACMHAIYVAIRTGDFSHIRWILDSFHALGHNCGPIYSPDGYDVFILINTSMIEQYHARLKCLETSFQGMKLNSAMMLLQHLQRDLSLEFLKEFQYPLSSTQWPAPPTEESTPRANRGVPASSIPVGAAENKTDVPVIVSINKREPTSAQFNNRMIEHLLLPNDVQNSSFMRSLFQALRTIEVPQFRALCLNKAHSKICENKGCALCLIETHILGSFVDQKPDHKSIQGIYTKCHDMINIHHADKPKTPDPADLLTLLLDNNFNLAPFVRSQEHILITCLDCKTETNIDSYQSEGPINIALECLDTTTNERIQLSDIIERGRYLQEVSNLKGFCEKCNKLTDITQVRDILFTLPEVLFLNLNYHGEVLDEYIELSEYVSINSSKSNTSHNYGLRAAIVFISEVDKFVCYSKHGETWFKCDGDIITVVAFHEVSHCNPQVVLIHAITDHNTTIQPLKPQQPHMQVDVEIPPAIPPLSQSRAMAQLLQPIYETDMQEIRLAWNAPPSKVVVEVPCGAGRCKVELLGEHMCRLNPETGGLLNDEVINAYMFLVTERDFHFHITQQPAQKKKKRKLRNHIYSSFFMWMLLAGRAVSRYATKTITRDIFKLSKLLIPINIEGSPGHWILLCINFENKVVQIYDSIAGLADESKFLEAIKKYLIDEAKKTHPDVADDLLDISTWSFKKSFREIDGKSVSVCTPQQTNSCDCGVFVCVIANLLCADAPLDFDDGNMHTFRKRITLDIKRINIAQTFQSH